MNRKIDWKKEGRKLLQDYTLIVLGAFVTGIAFAMFFLPHDIAPGGVTGLATVGAAWLPVGVGFLSFIINVPLFILGGKNAGWRFMVRSFAAMLLLSLFIDLLPHIDVCGDGLLASVFGGLLMGIGLGLVVRAGATTGGTDMAAKLIHDRIPVFSIAAVLLAIDSMVILIAIRQFGIQAGCYALISCYVSSKAMDAIVQGFNTAMQLMIITRSEKKIVERIHGELGRGCTAFTATGTYSNNPVGSLMCVCSRMEVPRLKKIISEEDPKAFVTVCDVREALGEGFVQSV
ncbi:MAG: YitT family protein [Clostridia bacterium]|nr:YitT family protein [Clostridia bacterium]